MDSQEYLAHGSGELAGDACATCGFKVCECNELFWEKVDKDGPIPGYGENLGPCWIWMACTMKNGYGQFRDAGETVYAHRYSYEAIKGPIPEGMELDHLCRVRNCVNPSHLEPVTTKENSLRGFSFAAMNARKTCCPLGHEYIPGNIYFTKEGYRVCRTCRLERERRKYAAQG